jgi:hypothetical protein
VVRYRGREAGPRTAPAARAGAGSASSLAAENVTLREKVRELGKEREIPRRTAKYFAGETRRRAAAGSSPTTTCPGRRAPVPHHRSVDGLDRETNGEKAMRCRVRELLVAEITAIAEGAAGAAIAEGAGEA